MTASSNRALLWFCIAWLLLNVLQAAFTGLANDEAYYWMYAKNLDVGYFDHPPMIALMIRAGYWLFHSELGLRLFTVLLGTLIIPVLYRLTDKKDFPLLVLLTCSATVFQVYGFIAVPDAPLMFFTALFFLTYRDFLAHDGFKETIFLTIVIALLLYSKYHGFLILFFTLLSNRSLFRRKTFYAVIAGAVALYLPHILWQLWNDLPSYQYHVLNKSQSYYNPLDSLSFMAGVLLVAGPFAGGLLIYAAVKYRTKEPMLRAMRFTFFGFFLFFLVSTFNAPVEANWMAASIVPLVVVAHGYIRERQNLRRWTVRLAMVSLVVFAFFRVNLMTDLVPALGSKAMPEFYGWNEWAEEVKKHAKGEPVVIMNSYQKASKYSFYTGEDALSLNNVAYRRNQFDIWNIVDSLQGKRVALFMTYADGRDSLETFETPRGKMQVLFIDNFHSYTKVRIETEKDWYHFKPGTDVAILLIFHGPNGGSFWFDQHTAYPASLVCERYYYEKFDQEIQLLDLSALDPDWIDFFPWKRVVKIRTPDVEGPYYLRFGIKTGNLPAYINSHLIRMDVEK